MTDIVERLRATYAAWNNPPSPELPEGAEVLLRAAEEVERLRAALQEIIDIHQSSTAISIARAALRERGQGQEGG